MQYIVTSTNSRHFDITDDSGAPAGMLSFAIWLPARAHITTAAGIVYEITSTGFWQTNKLITRGDVACAELKPDFNRGVYIYFENGVSVYFRRRSFWVNSEFVLTDNDGNEVAAITAYFDWKNFSYSYTIDIFETVADQEIGAVLPMILLYCARLLRMRHSA